MNYKKIYNSFSQKYEYCNLAGDACGLRVKTDHEYNRWTSSAGEERGKLINGELQYYPNRLFIDDMYLKGINSFNKTPNGSIFLFGNRITTLKSSSLDRLTTRNLSNYMIRELEKASRYFIFELIDDFIVSRVKNDLERFLKYVKIDRGITDFSVSVKADKPNNKLIIDIIFMPNYVTDFIQINFINMGTSSLITVK
jgi:phage tail sheath protein FI